MTRRRHFIWVLVLLGSFVPLAQVRSQTPPPPPLTQARQILNLSPEDAARGLPVKLQGVVNLFDAAYSLSFVHDGSASIYFYGGGTNLQTGQWIELEGKSARGRFAPIVEVQSLRVLGTQPLPAPTPIAIAQMAIGSHDSQWVAVTGIVQSQRHEWGNLVLEIVEDTSTLSVRVLGLPEPPKTNWVDARVRVAGVAGTFYNRKGQLNGFHLMSPGLAQIEILEPPTPDPMAQPVTQSAALLSYANRHSSGHRVRLQGTVTLHWPGERLFIQDDSGGLRIDQPPSMALRLGNVVDVAGFPVRSGYSPRLQHAHCRVIRSGEPIAPKRVLAEQIMNGEHDNELVELDARLLHFDDSPADPPILLVAQGSWRFRVIAPRALRAILAELEEESQLQLTGLCQVQLDSERKPVGFELLLREASDLRLARRAPWWMRPGFRSGLNGAALITAFGLLWALVLQRQVRTRTKAIHERERRLEDRYRELFENANDVIYSHDLDGRLIRLNRAGEELLGYTATELTSLTVLSILAPDQWALAQSQMRQKLETGGRTLYELRVRRKDGAELSFEINSRLILQDGKAVGVEGIARDITQRKADEAELRRRDALLHASARQQEKLARDLHDRIIQSLYAVGLSIDGSRLGLSAAHQPVRDRLKACVDDVNHLIRDVRGYILGLDPPVVHGPEFRTALSAMLFTLDRSSTQGGRLHEQIDPDALARLTAPQATQLLFIAREALSNSVRHAHASDITVALTLDARRVRFTVADNGQGFHPETASSQGRGLRNLRSRALDVHADCLIESQPGRGCTVTVTFPET